MENWKMILLIVSVSSAQPTYMNKYQNYPEQPRSIGMVQYGRPADVYPSAPYATSSYAAPIVPKAPATYEDTPSYSETTVPYVAPETTPYYVETTAVYVAPETTTAYYVAPETTTAYYIAPETTTAYYAPETTTAYYAPETTTAYTKMMPETTTVYYQPETTAYPMKAAY